MAKSRFFSQKQNANMHIEHILCTARTGWIASEWQQRQTKTSEKNKTHTHTHQPTRTLNDRAWMLFAFSPVQLPVMIQNIHCAWDIHYVFLANHSHFVQFLGYPIYIRCNTHSGCAKHLHNDSRDAFQCNSMYSKVVGCVFFRPIVCYRSSCQSVRLLKTLKTQIFAATHKNCAQ